MDVIFIGLFLDIHALVVYGFELSGSLELGLIPLVPEMRIQ